MKMSHLFSQTLREDPANAEIESHKLLVRAGFIRQLGAGIYSLLPLALRATARIKEIIREEMNAIGGQEILMPVVHPAEIWKETRRYYEIGEEMTRFQDRKGIDMVLAMTHEEVVSDLARKIIRSYRQLPLLVYHIQTKWRDESRPRAGLIRVREFEMKDSYSLDLDEDGLDRQYRAHYQAYYNIFNRCGLPTVAVLADVGMMGGSMAHEYMYLTPGGEDTILSCAHCGYTANRQVAVFRKPEPDAETPLALEKVFTPGAHTIEEVSGFLSIPTSRTAKAVLMVATLAEGAQEVQKPVMALLRGDMNLNEYKLANALHAKELRPAQDEEIEGFGAVAGFASPVGLDPSKVLIIVDDLVAKSANLVQAPTSRPPRNVNYGRDYQAGIVTDIASAEEGYVCPNCEQPLSAARGIEVGNIFKLGTKYSRALGVNYLDKNGQEKPVIMGSYGIGIGRLLAAAAEEHHDELGLKLPISIAPFHVHLVALQGGEAMANELYAQLKKAGLDVLYDDRKETPGVKFNDADLIGIPIRVTIGKRSLQNGQVEIKLRRENTHTSIASSAAVEEILRLKSMLEEEIARSTAEVPFK